MRCLNLTYLINIVIKDSGAKHRNSICTDYCMVTSVQGFGDLLLAVYNHGHSILLHTKGNTMPSESIRG